MQSTNSEPRQASDIESFSELRRAAPALFLEQAGSDIFYSADWFENLLLNGFAPDMRLHLFLFEDPVHSTPHCLPMVSPKDRQHVLMSLSNYYSSLFGPIGPGIAETANLWNAIIRRIRASDPRWAIIDLHPLDSGNQFVPQILRALRLQGYWADSYFCFGNWYLKLDGRSCNEYLASLPAALRHTIRRARKKLDGAGAWSIDIESTPGVGLDAAITAFDTVYQRSWKRPEPHPQFIAALCRMAAERGWLRLGVLRIGEAPIAAQIWLIKDRRAMIFKLAYDSDHAKLSPGSVLSADLMRHAIDVDQVTEVDYLTGDDAYKRDWMSHRRERLGIVAFDPLTVRGLAGATTHFLSKYLKGVLAALRNKVTRPILASR